MKPAGWYRVNRTADNREAAVTQRYYIVTLRVGSSDEGVSANNESIFQNHFLIS